MLNGKISKLNEVIKDMNFIQKNGVFNRKEKDLFVQMVLISGRVTELRVKDKTIIDLIRTLTECGVENPVTSFQIEELIGKDSGSPYTAVVVRLADKKQTSEQYIIPFKVQSILETLYDNKPMNKDKK